MKVPKISTSVTPKHSGPAELNEKEALFVQELITHGSATLAAEAAGYNRSSAAGLTKRLSPFIEKNTREIIGRNAPLALMTLIRVMETTEDDGVKLKAAQDILDRAGYNQVQKHEVTVGEKSDEEVDRQLNELLGKANVIDVTPESEL